MTMMQQATARTPERQALYQRNGVFNMERHQFKSCSILSLILTAAIGVTMSCEAKAGNRTIVTPDVAVIQWIENDGQFLQECGKQLQPHFGTWGPICAALAQSSNNYPPDHFAGPGYRDWNNWTASKEYRGYIHLPSMTVVCDGNNEVVSANPRDLDYADENNPTSRPDVIKDSNRSPYGYTKIPMSYALGDVYLDKQYNGLSWSYSPEHRIGRPRETIHLNDQRAARLADVERHAQWLLTHYDAPFIYDSTDVSFSCVTGDTEVIVNASTFPSTRLYINGRKVKDGYIKQDRLYEFIVAGGPNLANPGHGVLAPATAHGIYWKGR